MDTANAHVTSLDQLEAMLAAGTISGEDYSVLREAFDGSPRRRAEQLEPMAAPVKRWGKSWKNRQLGGVCGGIAEAMNLSAWALRLVFIFAFFISAGGAFFVYLFLYIALPWKEDEEHLVWRFPGAFFFTTLALWGIFQATNMQMSSWLAGAFQPRSQQPPPITLWLIHARAFLSTPSGFLAQLAVLACVFIVYGIAPRNGTTRKALAWSVCCGLLILNVAVFVLQLSGTYRLR